MLRRDIRRALVAALAGVVSSVTTSSILAQYPKAQLTGKTETGVAAHRAVAGGLTVAPVASFRLPGMEVTPVDGGVEVTGLASIQETRPGVIYLWTLRVFKNQGAEVLVLNRPYTWQTFAVGESGELSANFQDKLDLAPGEYRIELSLSDLPANYDTARLQSEKVANLFRVIFRSKQVTVEG
ncbi:MAG: hypothetical protein NVSMB9_21440 [Isosphaeraceae bacterium]